MFLRIRNDWRFLAHEGMRPMWAYITSKRRYVVSADGKMQTFCLHFYISLLTTVAFISTSVTMITICFFFISVLIYHLLIAAGVDQNVEDAELGMISSVSG